MPTISPAVTPYYGGGQVVNPANVIYAVGAPSTTLYRLLPGTISVDTTNGNAYVLVQVASATATWYLMGGSSAGLTGLEADDSTTCTESGGVITVSGGSTGLTTTASGSTLSFLGTLAVGYGGTGATTLTGVLTGNGTGAVTANAVTQHGVLVAGASNAVASLSVGGNGTILVGSAAANPVFATPSSTTGVAFGGTAGAFTVNIKQGGFAVTPVAGASQALTSQGTFIANDSAQTTFTLPATSAVGDIINVIGSALNTGGWKITYGSNQIIWGPAGSSTLTTGNAATGSAAAQTASLMCVVADTTWVIFANSGTITLT